MLPSGASLLGLGLRLRNSRAPPSTASTTLIARRFALLLSQLPAPSQRSSGVFFAFRRPKPAVIPPTHQSPTQQQQQQRRQRHDDSSSSSSSSVGQMSQINGNSKQQRKRVAAGSTAAAAATPKIPRIAGEVAMSEGRTKDTQPRSVMLTSGKGGEEPEEAVLDAELLDGVRVLDEPVKSESDKKSYRVIQLANGLRALLISDPTPIEPPTAAAAAAAADTTATTATTDDDDEDETSGTESDGDGSDDDDDDRSSNAGDSAEKLAACSLCIDVGSFSDPPDIQGLAHFVEHMIFMGSARYPAENAFDAYIKKCGGSDNAHTNAEETQFYFEAGEPALDGAMDRFASLFREPLMRKEAMQREREAVESEFANKTTVDSIRREQVLVSMGSEGHPCSLFGWGNQLTLGADAIEGGDEALYARAHEFRRRHYSAHRMTLAVQARWPLDELHRLVQRHWSDMPTNQQPGDEHTALAANWRHAFRPQFSEQLIILRPVANIRRLEMTFCLPPLLDRWRSRPACFAAYLVGHEGVGSLCAYLRRQLYALDLVAGVEEDGYETNRLYTLFTVAVHLTPLGLANVRRVYAATLAYLRFLATIDARRQEQLFRELQQIDATSFRFRTDQQPVDNCEELAVALKQYPSRELFTADALYLDYEPAGIEEVLRLLTDAATPCNVMLTSRTLPEELAAVKMDRRERWFGAEYAQLPFPEGWEEERRAQGISAEFATEFGFLQPNQYVTTDFGILYKEVEGVKVPEFPQRLLDDAQVELWYRQDDRFLLPVAYYNFYLQSPVFRGSVENYVMAALLPMLLKFRVIERLYPAQTAGLGYDCFTSDKGLVLRVSGYNQQLPRLVETLGEALRTFADELTEVQFNTFVEEKLRDYYNMLIKPKSLAKILRLNIFEHQFVPTLDKFEHLKTVRLDAFRAYARRFLASLRIQCLMQGNLSADQATAITQRFVAQLQPGPITDPTALQLRTRQLPPGSAHYLRVRNLNATDTNTVTTNYYQLGPISIRLNCLLALLLQVVEEPCFDELRTKQQLGYDVGCTLRDNFGVLGYTVTIVSQETRHSAAACEAAIEQFRRGGMLEAVRNLTDAEFAEHRETLVRLKLTADTQLYDELQRNWAEVTAEELMFDRHRREVECLRAIGREEFVRFYERHCGVGAERKVSVQVIGCGRQVERNGQVAEKQAEEPEKQAEPESIFSTRFEPLQMVELAEPRPEGAEWIADVERFRQSLAVYPVCKTGDSLE